MENTLHAIDAQHELVRDVAGLRRATKIILPGVGNFGQMMRSLDQLGVRDALIERIRAGVPFFGICLGLQALFERSEEAPEQRGLGLLEGTVRRFRDVGRVPHMGWNSLDRLRESSLLHGIDDRPFVYFANSYYAPVVASTSASSDYGGAFTAVIESANISGVQFHPEKSGPVGIAIVRNFVCS